MTDTKYNGWTNYATWRVNLEIFDGIDLAETFAIRWWNDGDQNLAAITYDLSKDLEAYAEDLIFIDTPEGLSRDYALAFLAEVNWYEIADHMIRDHIAENEEIAA